MSPLYPLLVVGAAMLLLLFLAVTVNVTTTPEFSSKYDWCPVRAMTNCILAFRINFNCSWAYYGTFKQHNANMEASDWLGHANPGLSLANWQMLKQCNGRERVKCSSALQCSTFPSNWILLDINKTNKMSCIIQISRGSDLQTRLWSIFLDFPVFLVLFRSGFMIISRAKRASERLKSAFLWE